MQHRLHAVKIKLVRKLGLGGAWDGEGHPRWPQIVSASPNGVNPAARPIPPGGDSRAPCGDELVGLAGSGFRVDTVRSRQVLAWIAGMTADGQPGRSRWDAGAVPGFDEATERRAADFFVSYTASDERWAEWIGWVLEDAGYRVVIQAWDFGPGSHFVTEMHRATQHAARTIAVLSAAYQASVFAAEEWQAAWVADPDGRGQRLVALRVEDCPRNGLLRQLVSVDLFGIDRETAKTRLLAAVRGDQAQTRGRTAVPRQRRWRWWRGSGGAAVAGAAAGVAAGVAAQPELRRPGRRAGTGAATVHHGRGDRGGGAAGGARPGWGGQDPVGGGVRLPACPRLRVGVVAGGRATGAGGGRVGGVGRPARGGGARGGAEVRGGGGRGATQWAAVPRWLVVADNAGGVWDLAGLLGVAGDHGHVLITSRDPGWSQATRTVAVDVLPRTQAITLLRARAPRLTTDEAEQVAEVLGDLPLALEQAGAWLASSGMSVSDYLDAVSTRTREILAEGRPHTYPVPVAATWTLALDTLDETAVGLLRLWAFLGPEPIPIDWITDETATAFPAELAALADPLDAWADHSRDRPAGTGPARRRCGSDAPARPGRAA